MQQKDIHNIIRDAEHNLIHNSTKLGKYVSYSHLDTVEKINAYSNSKHTSGDTDSLGREKPFFNIVTAAENIWYRATDLDRKNIKFIPTNESSVILAFVANVLLQKWMDKAKFGQFLNKWGRILARYGSAITKFVEQNGELKATVTAWNRAIVDPVDFEALPKIEKFYLTPAQLLKKKEYDQKVVEDLIKDVRESRETMEGTDTDFLDEFIELYEVHGELPNALLLDKEPASDDPSWDKYTQKMFVVTFTQTKDGDYKDYNLFSGRESKEPNMLTHLIEEDGRTLSIGSIETLFDSQWMHNHAMKSTKDILDLASRIMFQTADKRFIGRNVLSNIESGDIMIHEDNKPLTRIANDKPDVTAWQNFSLQWKNLASELTSTPDAIKGNTLPSGTPYSLGAYLGAQANSLFEQMTENKGLHLEDMIRTYIIPHLKKTLKNKDEIVAILDDAGIEEIDSIYIPREAVKRFNKRTAKALLDNVERVVEGGELSPLQPFDLETEAQPIKEELQMQGNKRFFKPDEMDKKTWKDLFSDFQWDNIRVEVTNENSDKQAVMQTLASLYATTAQTDPVAANVILGEIMNQTGVISPLRLRTAKAVPQPAQPA